MGKATSNIQVEIISSVICLRGMAGMDMNLQYQEINNDKSEEVAGAGF